MCTAGNVRGEEAQMETLAILFSYFHCVCYGWYLRVYSYVWFMHADVLVNGGEWAQKRLHTGSQY